MGSDPEIQVPNLVSNHLTTGLLNYIHTTGRYTSGQNLFEKLRSRDNEISSLLARVLIAGDEEVNAVRVLKEAIEDLPMDYSLLDCQATFLQSKGNLEWALPLAQRAVTAAPSEFGTWAKLAEIYVGLEQWDLALLTLNSCPMFTYQDKDAPRMPEPLRVLLPVLSDTQLDEIDESQGYDNELIHPSLRKLNAAGYKGTFLKAYSLLTDITAKIGWDQLLRIRSQVFVMEEEYRSEKQIGGQTTPSRNASTLALRGTPSPGINGNGRKAVEGDTAVEQNGTSSASTENSAIVGDSNGDVDGSTLGIDESIEKPEHTVASEEVKSGNEAVSPCESGLFPMILIPSHSPIPPTQITLISSISAFVSGGSTICLWSSTKIFEYIQSGVQTWRARRLMRRLTLPAQVLTICIKNQQKNGKSLVN